MKEDFDALATAKKEIDRTSIVVDDTAVTLALLRSRIRKLKIKKGKLDLVLIDYLQLLQVDGFSYSNNRVQEISAISR